MASPGSRAAAVSQSINHRRAAPTCQCCAVQCCAVQGGEQVERAEHVQQVEQVRTVQRALTAQPRPANMRIDTYDSHASPQDLQTMQQQQLLRHLPTRRGGEGGVVLCSPAATSIQPCVASQHQRMAPQALQGRRCCPARRPWSAWGPACPKADTASGPTHSSGTGGAPFEARGGGAMHALYIDARRTPITYYLLLITFDMRCRCMHDSSIVSTYPIYASAMVLNGFETWGHWSMGRWSIVEGTWSNGALRPLMGSRCGSPSLAWPSASALNPPCSIVTSASSSPAPAEQNHA